MLDVLIVGGGPAGMAASIWCKRLGLKSVLFEKNEGLGGQLDSINNPVIDYLGIPVLTGKELVPYFVSHVEKLGCLYKCNVSVQKVDVREKKVFAEDQEWAGNSLILAMGSRERKLGVPGEKEMIARGEVYSTSRDGHLFQGKSVAVVGGGDRALEGALLLAEAGARVELIHRSAKFRARPEFRDRALSHPSIRVHTNTRVTHIRGDGQVQSIDIESTNPIGMKDSLEVDAVFVRIGIEPNSELIQDQLQLDPDGYIQTDADGETSAKNVYAIGDICVRPLYTSISLSVGQAAKVVKKIAADIFYLPR